jgi:PPK2 family polyphosphate:nucleotide phosphotransferase
MASGDDLIAKCRVPHGKKVRLKDYDPAWAGDPKLPKEERKQIAEQSLTQDVSELAEVQDRMYAADSWSILMIFQAMDAASKDSTIKYVMSGVNPQGCQVFSFKQPSVEELDHNFLWRYTQALPEQGRIGIFNRSYYEEVLVVRVHAELVKAQWIPGVTLDEDFWAERYQDINALERHLSRNGTVVLKFFLHVSKNEQRERFLKRLEDPRKHWKFSAADLVERGFWNDSRGVPGTPYRILPRVTDGWLGSKPASAGKPLGSRTGGGTLAGTDPSHPSFRPPKTLRSPAETDGLVPV